MINVSIPTKSGWIDPMPENEYTVHIFNGSTYSCDTLEGLLNNGWQIDRVDENRTCAQLIYILKKPKTNDKIQEQG